LHLSSFWGSLYGLAHGILRFWDVVLVQFRQVEIELFLGLRVIGIDKEGAIEFLAAGVGIAVCMGDDGGLSWGASPGDRKFGCFAKRGQISLKTLISLVGAEANGSIRTPKDL
jgi:hypothetical protein